MGNRIITFQQDPIQKRLQENPLEVFLDVSLNSHYVDNGLSIHVDIPNKSGIALKFDSIDQDVHDNTALMLDNETDMNSLLQMHVYSKDYQSNQSNSQQIIKISNDTYELERLVNVRAIRNSLKNIFSWIPGERVLLPEFGSNLRKLLYEGITQHNVEQVIAEIKHIVTKWEPRVTITNIVDASTVDDHENNTVHIKIIFVILGLSDEQFEYDYIQPIATQ